MHIRLVRYFLTVATEGHFARAAEVCGVTQPTLSAGLHALEKQLGKRLIVRERRYIGLTPEGEALIPWAKQMIAAEEGMHMALSSASGALHGDFRMGAIPAAQPFVGKIAQALLNAHPTLSLSVRSMTSREIVRALGDYELDCGLTYLDHEPPTDVLTVPLYDEGYRVLVKSGSTLDARQSLPLAEVARLPLCLLHQGMQNRRILDARMARHGLTLRPTATADSYVTLLAMVQAGPFATIIPDSYVPLIPAGGWATVLEFEEPLQPSQIGLIVLDRTPLSPLAGVAVEIARTLI